MKCLSAPWCGSLRLITAKVVRFLSVNERKNRAALAILIFRTVDRTIFKIVLRDLRHSEKVRHKFQA